MAVSKPSAEPTPLPEPTFEQSLDELEGVVRQLESADLPLEKSLELFERGVALSETCRQQLTAAETRVEILVKKGQNFVAEPFEPEQE